MPVVLAFVLFAASIAVIPSASAQTATGQGQLTNSVCAELSLGGQKTYPADSDGDKKPDVCSVPSTRRETIARQLASEQLSLSLPTSYHGLVMEECRFLPTQQDFGDSAPALEQDACSTQNLTPLPPLAFHLRPFYSGVITSPSHCVNQSLGGTRAHPFDRDADGKADTCTLLTTRREAVVRQSAYLKLAGLFTSDYEIALTRACAALIQEGTNYGDTPADLARDICSTLVKVVEETTPGTGGGGGSPGTSPGVQIPQTTVPGAPTQLRITVANTALVVSWTAPAKGRDSITDYDVQYRACTTTPLTCATNPTWGDWTDRTGETASDTATNATLASLTNGTAYQVQVRAQNSVGEGPYSATGQATPSLTAPAEPAAPTLTVGHQSLAVSWSAPSDNGGAAVTGYKVGRCSTNCGTDTNWTVATLNSTGTTTTLTGLTNGTAYQVRVAATNSIGDSPWSPSATATPATTPHAPAAPSLTIGHQSLAVSWSAPSSNGGAAITDYNVNYRPVNGDAVNHPFSGTGTTTTITNLTNGTGYQVAIQAVNSQGGGNWSPWSATATPAAVPTAPGAPTLTVGNTQVTATWTESANNGAAITDYDVQYRTCTATPLTCASNPTWSSWTSHSHTGTATTATITNLTNGTALQAQVRAENSRGESLWSSSAAATPATTPGAPGTPTLTVQNTSLGVSWSAPSSNGGAAITGYKVGHCSTGCGTDSNWTVTNLNSTGTTTTVGSLTNGTAYQVRVAATNSQGDSSWSSSTTATPATTPDAPAAPTLTVQNTSLGIAWTAPDNGGAAITDYDVQYRKQNSDNTWPTTWTSHSHTGTATATTITGLTNGTAHQVQVQAENNRGESSWSSSATATPATTPDAPAAPNEYRGNQALGVSWTAPADGGAAITDYDVQYRACTNSADLDCSTNPTWGDWTDWTHTGTATTATITNLTNNTGYQIQVRAENSQGTSGWSSGTRGLPRQKPTDPSVTVSVTSDGREHHATLSFETTYVTAISQWQWQWRIGNAPQWQSLNTITTTSKKDSVYVGNLAPGYIHYFRARVCSSTCPTSAGDDNNTTSGWGYRPLDLSHLSP